MFLLFENNSVAILNSCNLLAQTLIDSRPFLFLAGNNSAKYENKSAKTEGES